MGKIYLPVQDMRVWSLTLEDPLEKKAETHRQPTVFLPGKSHGQRSLAGYRPWLRVTKSETRLTELAHTESLLWNMLLQAAHGVPCDLYSTIVHAWCLETHSTAELFPLRSDGNNRLLDCVPHFHLFLSKASWSSPKYNSNSLGPSLLWSAWILNPGARPEWAAVNTLHRIY